VTTRRDFIAAPAGLLTAPLAAEAQQATKVFRIGLLGGPPPTAAEASARLWDGFFQEMRKRGYVEGRNTIFDGRWYGEQTERLPALAAELVQLKVDVIVAGAAPAPEAAQRATSTIPVVFTSHPDPIGSGLVSFCIHDETSENRGPRAGCRAASEWREGCPLECLRRGWGSRPRVDRRIVPDLVAAFALRFSTHPSIRSFRLSSA
jgi:ABC transporter substrate binding protein